MDFYSEFKDYAMKHMGVSGLQMHYWEKTQDALYSNPTVTDSLTPMVLEERELRVTQMSVFDRLLMDGVLWIAGTVNDRMSTIVQAQLMWLDEKKSGDITMYIDTPGGSVKSGLSIIDTMDYISSDIITINTGMAASMGSVLLGAGTKGKRYSLKNSRVMLHQVSGGAQGNIQDMIITLGEAQKYNDTLFELLGEYCNKDSQKVKEDAKRDLWLTAKEAVEYGIIDDIVENKKIKKDGKRK
jgi:ATP-dependent Clp protease protease subunit